MGKAQDDFNAKNYDRLYTWIPKGKKEVLKKIAIQRQTSLNNLINELLEKAIENAEKEGKE